MERLQDRKEESLYMRKYFNRKQETVSIRLLFSYLAIILAPAVAIIIIYINMQEALLNIQQEKSQSFSREAVIALNNEMEQVVNVAKYISSSSELKKYMEKRTLSSSGDSFFRAYEMANSFPDYRILNWFIKNIYILPKDDVYIMQLPHVFPSNERGISTLDIIKTVDQYQNVLESFYDMGPDGIMFDRNKDGSGSFLVLQNFYFGNIDAGEGMILIEMDNSQIRDLLRSALGNDKGIAFLADAEGNVLCTYDCLEGRQVLEKEEKLPKNGIVWKDYLEKKGLETEDMAVTSYSTNNGWRLVTVIPQKILLAKIGWIRSAILALCIVSLFIGVAICLWYWNNSRPVVARYLKYSQKYPERADYPSGKASIWDKFGNVLTHAEDLQITIDKQKQWVREGILRKLLFGSYDSQEELEKEIQGAGIEFPVDFPCYLAVMDLEHPLKQELHMPLDVLEECILETLNLYLPYSYQMLSIDPLQYILFINVDDDAASKDLKGLFEKINYALYSQIPLNIHTGISEKADTPLTIAEEYEHVCRICDYAKYYKLRMPLILSDLPHHQHVTFPVEVEMQMEKAVRSGSREQLEQLMLQIKENHLRVLGGGPRPVMHNLEVVRCVLLRCMEGEPEDAVKEFLKKIHRVRNVEEMEQTIFEVWDYFAQKRVQDEDKATEELKQEIERKIEQEYSSSDFNLAVVADWLQMPEKKLYRDFKKMYGVSFSSYLEVLRMRYAQEKLKDGQAVQDVAAAVGYGSDYSFRRAFKLVVGVTPSDYQKMH